MVYILSINLKNNKKVFVELTKLYGIGKYQSNKICNSINIGKDCRIGDLTQTCLYTILKQIEQNNLLVEVDLKEQNQESIAELIKIKSYRGIRHIYSLPVRGQRSRNTRSHKKLKGK